MVLLIDEIDKADPDVPNSLLRPLGDLAFEVEETGQRIEAGLPAPVVLITTNEERDLPPAFLRRCVELNMPLFDQERLVSVGQMHHPDVEAALVQAVAKLVVDAGGTRERRHPNPAEFLDVLRACRELGIQPSSPAFQQLTSVVLG
jgi:MoxR-like ATPase